MDFMKMVLTAPYGLVKRLAGVYDDGDGKLHL
jgi:hypothetical protein